jgi:MFS family permease
VIADRNIWRLYRATLVLGVAYGLSVSVIALHLDDLGFHEQAIGGLAAWFAAGIVALSIPAGRLVHRVGAQRTLVGALLGYAVSACVFPLLTSFATIAAARLLDGACSACIWVSCETILLRRSSAANKAQVMSLYAMAMAIGYVVGPLLAHALVSVLPLSAAFVASAALAAGAAGYVALRLEPDPRDPHAAPGTAVSHRAAGVERTTPALALLARIKTSCFATFAYGYFEASVVLFLPLYLMHDKGIARDKTVLVTAFFAAGMLLFTNVAGRLGDRFGHLLLMRILAVVGGSMVFAFIRLGSFAPMAVAVFVAGATLASISPVSLALQGVVTDPEDYDRANGIYNAFYATGIFLGPPVTSVVFAHWGGAAMLAHLGALWAAFVAFATAFAADDPASSRRSTSCLTPQATGGAGSSPVATLPSVADSPSISAESNEARTNGSSFQV